MRLFKQMSSSIFPLCLKSVSKRALCPIFLYISQYVYGTFTVLKYEKFRMRIECAVQTRPGRRRAYMLLLPDMTQRKHLLAEIKYFHTNRARFSAQTILSHTEEPTQRARRGCILLAWVTTPLRLRTA